MDRWQEDENIELKKDGSIIRGVKRIATVKEGHVETYRRWNHVAGTTYGARLVDLNTEETKVETEDHESETDAGNWLKLALGILAAAIGLLVFG